MGYIKRRDFHLLMILKVIFCTILIDNKNECIKMGDIVVRNREKLLTIRKEMIETLTAHSVSKNEVETLYKLLDDILFAMNESTNISITNDDGTILYVNDQFCKLAKYNKEEIIGQNYKIVNSGYHPKEFFQQMWQVIMNGETWRGEIQNKAKDGSTFWISTTVVPLTYKNGQPYQFISFQTDITEKKQIEKQLQEKFKSNIIRTIQNLRNGIFKVRKEQGDTLLYSMSEGKLMEELGLDANILLNKSPFDVFEREIANLKQHSYLEAFDGKRVDYEIELNGKLVYVDVTPIEHDGEITEIVGTVHDVSEFRNTQKKLKLNEQRYRSLINYSHEYITTLDKDGIIIDMNPKTMEMLGFQEEMFGKVNIVEATVEEERNIIADYFEKAVCGEIQFFEFEVKNNGQRRFLSVTLLPIIIDDTIEGVYSIGKDITEEKIVQQQNAYLVHHDELTELPNRRWMEQKIKDSLKLAEQNCQELAIIYIDLDRFKSINDTLGHYVGDQLLQQISIRLQKNINQQKHLVARMGGDEFMILCPILKIKDEVTDIAQKILDSLENPFYVQGYELLITASMGIVLYPSSGADVTELMKKVDIALYKAKELGRNMYQVYDTSMSRKDYQSFEMERDLRKAIMNNEFTAHFQPRVDALSGKTVSAEALIRWNHLEYGLISPGEFIPLAEETGLIIAIGKWMKKRVCEQLVAWRNSGLPLIPISVNISSNRFLQHGFAEDIRRLLEQYKLEGEWLEIEITENSIMRNEDIVQKTLKDLKEMGVKVYIDDFGTGYSSFNYLKTFNLDGVKIDRSFIQNISNKSENASITTAMIKMAQHLKLEVIAEGVETKEELDYLMSENCRYIQGFYFGRPCPIEEFEKNHLNIEKE